MNLSAEQQRNADTVRRLYACERRGDLEGWIALWHRDARQIFPWGDGRNDVRGIDALRASTAHKFKTRRDVVIDDRVMPMADPRWVFAIAGVSIHFTEIGRTLEAELWCRFHFDAEGLILEQQEVL
ncbi:nuclear transport factor 2 family protein, partial [Polymorphobacter sp.]|uniref:nuclear transport factor 2 family protein n=1 Tax=Polymorphobacter sp. TaxID=1909290 RepID=UPI003F6E6D5F